MQGIVISAVWQLVSARGFAILVWCLCKGSQFGVRRSNQKLASINNCFLWVRDSGGGSLQGMAILASSQVVFIRVFAILAKVSL